jgi:hypothetical protein
MTETRLCPLCGRPFQPRGRQRWCSDACRARAFRRRHPAALAEPVPILPAGRAHIVYRCPECERRYLGVQICEDCHAFCHRVGAGGLCPACDEPVAIADLE